MLILDHLARTWAADAQLRREALRWSWFREAFQAVLDSGNTEASVSCRANLDALVKAFFEWVQSVAAYASYEDVDRIDFLHFTCGLLLQKLLAAKPPVLMAVGDAGSRPGDDPSADWPQAKMITGFVLTLLQALRIHEGAPAVESLAGAGDNPWAGLRESFAEDPATAIAFLDQLCGLQPEWQYPSLIESRPAMQRALAQSRARA